MPGAPPTPAPGGYGAPPAGSFGTPPAGGYGAPPGYGQAPGYGAPAGYGAAPPPAATAKKSGCVKWGLIIGAILLVLTVGVVGCSALLVARTADTISDAVGSADPNDYALTLDSCSLVDGVAEAEGTFSNLSDKRQGFQVTVEFTDESGTVIGTGIDIVSALDVGDETEWTASPPDFTNAQVIQCTVTDVSYTLFDQ